MSSNIQHELASIIKPPQNNEESRFAHEYLNMEVLPDDVDLLTVEIMTSVLKSRLDKTRINVCHINTLSSPSDVNASPMLPRFTDDSSMSFSEFLHSKSIYSRNKQIS
jgi:hypothetical protein